MKEVCEYAEYKIYRNSYNLKDNFFLCQIAHGSQQVRTKQKNNLILEQ